VPLAGRPMVEWSVDAFRAAGVAEIVVACPPGHEHSLGNDVVVVDGGATRSESVSNAMEAVGTALVVVHDAARPLVTPALIEGVLSTLADAADAAAAITATPVTDTVKRGTDATRGQLCPSEGPNRPLVEATLDRERLWAAQTPQVFRTAALREALAAHPDPDAATDEAMLVEAAGGQVLIHPSPAENIKVTTPLDLRLAELVLAGRSFSAAGSRPALPRSRPARPRGRRRS
jgi:2-C-methyl-D-erythritol 4-phosphate cytidylyltransferase